MVDRATTHQAKNKVHSDDVLDHWKSHICSVIYTHNLQEQNVANYDETNVSFDMPGKRCLDWRGKNLISIVTASTSDRCTAMLGCTMPGKTLPVHVIYKAKRKGHIERNELKNLEGYPLDMTYAVQDNAWMDEVAMMDWISQSWIPYAVHPDRNGLCLLIMDELKTHMCAGVLAYLGKNNTIAEFVPPGYTAKPQVMDVGLNRPFKTYLSDQYQTFVKAFRDMHLPGVPIKPHRHDVA
jgi:hypothetical protein